MSLSRDTRNEKKLKLIRRAEFRLKQGLERIDWEEDTLLPELSEFKARAQLPELPIEKIVTVDFDVQPKEKPRASRKNSK